MPSGTIADALQIHNYNTPKGSDSYCAGGFAEVSACIGREGDEAERCGGFVGVDPMGGCVLPALSWTEVHGVRGKAAAGDGRVERVVNEGLDDECPKLRRRSGLTFFDAMVLCASSLVVGELLGKGGYPEMWDKPWSVVGVPSWAPARALRVSSSNNLASSMVETDPLRIFLAYAKDSSARRFLRNASSPSSP